MLRWIGGILLTKKNANDPRAVVISPFGGTKPSFFVLIFSL